MNDSPISASFRSTSANSMLSEDSNEIELFPDASNLHVVKKLSDAKFPVYLVSYPPTGQYYAMKIFPWDDYSPSSFFLKEIRFSKFFHPNIVPIVYVDYEQESSSSGHSTKVSYLLMEYAKYGDMFDVLISYKISFDDILIRTYFHQMIHGLEALHSQGAAHLDIKLENLLMSGDYTLKLVDFDLSYMPEDGKVQTRGTKNFRAPELLAGKCTNPQAADVYSAGIILFLFKTGGLLPYREDDEESWSHKMDSKKFWKNHCSYLDVKSTFFSKDFKALFMWMTRLEPEERPTIAQIKQSRWYNKEVYSAKELFTVMNRKLGHS